jgi:predicted DNA-binding mobile mystery protein A
MLDAQLAEPKVIDALKPTMGAWCRTVREAIGLPVATLAERLEISQPSATQLEINESTDKISLARLKAIAQALDCELVYGFVPKQSFTKTAKTLEHAQQQAVRAHRTLPRP